MKKKIIYIQLLFIILLSQQSIFSFDSPASKAVGIFLTTGVGARFPVGQFANSSNLGYGISVDASYTDSDHLPFFLFARFGYEQFPGSQDFYQQSDYSNYSTTLVPISVGLRYYFSPLVESAILLMPIIEASASYTYFQVLNEFKVDSGKSDYTEDSWNFGGTIGAGFSMFILEIIGNYSYYESTQYFSVNLNVRLPLFINM